MRSIHKWRRTLPKIDLDELDRTILSLLQADGRLTNVEVARRAGLSESACSRRVRALEERGVIEGWRVLVSPAAIGLTESVFVRVALDRQQEDNLAAFESAVSELPEVMECFLLSGDVDYLLRAVVRDTPDYERLHNRLTRLPGVARVHSSFTLRTVLKRTELPLG